MSFRDLLIYKSPVPFPYILIFMERKGPIVHTNHFRIIEMQIMTQEI